MPATIRICLKSCGDCGSAKNSPGVHAARDQVVARAFGRGLAENRRLHLEEALRVEVAADRRRHLVPQDHVARQARTAQIEIAVLQAYVLRHRRVVGDRERRRLRLVEQRQLPHDHFHFAGLELGIDRLVGAAADRAFDADHELGAQALGLGHQRLVVLVEDHLRDAARSRTSMNSRPPRSRTRCTHPSSTTFAPTSPGRRAPQVWVRVSSPSGSATILQCLAYRPRRRPSGRTSAGSGPRDPSR